MAINHKYKKERMLRLRMCAEAETALTYLKDNTDDTVTTIINNAILEAAQAMEKMNEEDHRKQD